MNKSYNWTVRGPKNRFGSPSIMESGTRSWMTQPKPWVKPLPYRYSMGKFTSLLNTSEFTYNPSLILGVADNLLDSKFAKQARNVAYADFISKLKPAQAEMLTLYAERQKTWSMITSRAVNLTVGLIAAKTGNVHALKQAWGRHAGIRSNLRKAGSHVLEYSFGWAPLMSDLASAVEVVANGVPPARITGRTKVPTQSTVWNPAPENYRGGFQYIDQWNARMGATIRIDNPNFALANQLGLLNPVATLWELTPWSFVVDYVVNVGDFISSFTDFAGFELTNAYTTTFMKRAVSGNTIYKYDDPRSNEGRTSLYGYTGEVLHIRRGTSIVKPVLATRPRVGMPIQRAATSIALLLQQLKTK